MHALYSLGVFVDIGAGAAASVRIGCVNYG